MSRSARPHQPGTLSYIQLVANARREVFIDDADRAYFSELVARFAPACHVRVHAFCWSYRAASMVVQVAQIPLASFIRRLASQHARRMNLKEGYQGNLFGARYRATRLATPTELLNAVREVHLIPIEQGAAPGVQESRWSSHDAYGGTAKPAWLRTQLVMQALEAEYGAGVDGYVAFMSDHRGPVAALDRASSKATPGLHTPASAARGRAQSRGDTVSVVSGGHHIH